MPNPASHTTASSSSSSNHGSHGDETVESNVFKPVKGVIVIARNGDRFEMFQRPSDYASAYTQTTALGEAQSHILGSQLRSIYLSPSSSSYIKGMQSDIVDHKQIHVRVKAGGEGSVVFDSALALLQGLYPPHPNNKIELANGTTVTAPLGGYQYVPVETVEPGNDKSLEPWSSCPAFEKHIAEFHKSEKFKAKEKDASEYFQHARDFIFGRPATLENSWNIYDFMSSQLTHNKTYAYRLPPGLINTARDLANFHEDGVFSDEKLAGIGNIAGRTMLHTILSSMQRFESPKDPLKFVLVETSYHPFISLFHQTEITKEHPELRGMPDYGSALAIELRAGPPPDARDFLRFKFKNGTGGFETVHVLGHKEDIPVTEFMFRIEDAAITSNKEWAQACRAPSRYVNTLGLEGSLDLPKADAWPCSFGAMFISCAVIATLLLGFARGMKARARAHRVRLDGEDNITATNVHQPSASEKVRYV
jgi:lysosomal acid phosphatase